MGNRYTWVNEEPKPDFTTCGQSVRGCEYTMDEFLEEKHGEPVLLHCVIGKREVTLHDIGLTSDYEVMTFGDMYHSPEIVAKGVRVDPVHVLKTHFEHRVGAKTKVFVEARRGQLNPFEKKNLCAQANRKTMRRHLIRLKMKDDMRSFLPEAHLRKVLGYSLDVEEPRA